MYKVPQGAVLKCFFYHKPDKHSWCPKHQRQNKTDGKTKWKDIRRSHWTSLTRQQNNHRNEFYSFSDTEIVESCVT